MKEILQLIAFVAAIMLLSAGIEIYAGQPASMTVIVSVMMGLLVTLAWYSRHDIANAVKRVIFWGLSWFASIGRVR
jgi:hypothetical protein